MPTETQKFKELILYVAKESQADPKCGSTKLNKILFYADFRAHLKLGRSISGEPYQKLEHGPAPKRIVPVVEELKREGECAWAERDYYGLRLKKLLSLREPVLSVFSPEEVDIVRSVITELWDLSATEVSDLSHRFIGWQAAEIGEEIPYETVFVGEPRPLTLEEEAWVLDVIEEHREQAPAKHRQRAPL